MKFKALYALDSLTYHALLDDGTLVKLMTDASRANYTVTAIDFVDVRPKPPKAKTTSDSMDASTRAAKTRRSPKRSR